MHLAGDWITNARASLIGLNLPGMRAADIIRGVDLLAVRPDVNAASISAAAHAADSGDRRLDRSAARA